MPHSLRYPLQAKHLGRKEETIDVAVFQFVNGLETPWLDPVFVFLSSNLTWALVGAAYALWSLATRRWSHLRAAVVLGLAVILADLLSYRVLKPAFARPRPCHALENVELVGTGCGGEYGLPSNHAANALAVTAASAILYGRRVASVAFVLSLLVGLSRVKMGVHYPGDVLFGFVVGAIVGSLVAFPLRCWVGLRSP